MIRETYTSIKALQDFSPSDEVNSLFSTLVKESLDDTVIHDLSEEEIDDLQQKSAQAEYSMELYWTEKIISSPNPTQALQEFWYYQNYVDLTRIEWGGLQSCCDENHQKGIIFLGSGPLPLTAIVLATRYDCEITLLDIDHRALELSKKLIASLGLQDKFTFITADASTFTEYASYNVIYVAALAGLDNETKTRIVDNIRTHAQDSAHIIMRSAYANRTLLYRPLTQHIFKTLKPLIEIRPHNDVVNSIVIFSNAK